MEKFDLGSLNDDDLHEISKDVFELTINRAVERFREYLLVTYCDRKTTREFLKDIENKDLINAMANLEYDWKDMHPDLGAYPEPIIEELKQYKVRILR